VFWYISRESQIIEEEEEEDRRKYSRAFVEVLYEVGY